MDQPGGGWEEGFDASAVADGDQAASWLPKPSWEDTLRSSVTEQETWEDQLAASVAPTRPPRSPPPPPRVPRDGPEEAARRAADARAAGRLPSTPPSPFHPPSAGTGVVPRGKQPKREEDWWSPDDLDPGIAFKYGVDTAAAAAAAEGVARVAADGDERGEGIDAPGRCHDETDGDAGGGGGEGARGVGTSGGGGSDEDAWWDLAELDQNIVREATRGRGGDAGDAAAAGTNGHAGDFAEWGDEDYSAGEFNHQTNTATAAAAAADGWGGRRG